MAEAELLGPREPLGRVTVWVALAAGALVLVSLFAPWVALSLRVTVPFAGQVGADFSATPLQLLMDPDLDAQGVGLLLTLGLGLGGALLLAGLAGYRRLRVAGTLLAGVAVLGFLVGILTHERAESLQLGAGFFLGLVGLVLAGAALLEPWAGRAAPSAPPAPPAPGPPAGSLAAPRR